MVFARHSFWKRGTSHVIPQGKAILVPLLTGFCDDDNTDPAIKTEEGLRKCAMAGNEYGVISAKLDGVDLQNLNHPELNPTSSI